MTPRKEIYIKIKEALTELPELELVDLFRKQFDTDASKLPQWTAALIKVNRITWEYLVEQRQEGTADIDIMLYTKDGWLNQQNGTNDADSGLIEIDLIDSICEKLDGLSGDSFNSIKIVSDEVDNNSTAGIMSYRITVKCTIYRKLNDKFTKRQIGFRPQNFTT